MRGVADLLLGARVRAAVVAAGLGKTELAAESARSHGIAFTVVNPSHEVRRVLGLTGADLDLIDAPDLDTPDR